MSLAASTTLLGAILLGLGLPRLLGEVALVTGNHVVEALKQGESLDAAASKVLLDSRTSARPFLPASRTELDIGLERLAVAQSLAPGSPERDLLLDQAVASFRSGLMQQPRDSYAWARLAHAVSMRDRPDAATAAWRMSILTGPAEPSLVLWRVKLGFGMLSRLDADDQARLGEQVRFAWRLDRRALARYAHEHGLQLVLRRVLSTEPDVGELDRLFAAD